MGSLPVPLPQAGAKLVPTVSPSPLRPPVPQHHSQACLSAHHRAVLLLSGAPLGNRGQWGAGYPPAGGPAHRHPRHQGSGAHSRAVLTPSSCPRCAPGPGRGQSEMSPRVPAEGLSCSPQPFWGASPPLAAQVALLAGEGWQQSLPSPCLLQDRVASVPSCPHQLTVSLGSVGAFWIVHPAGDPSPAPPPAPFAPQHPTIGVPGRAR